MAGCVPAIHMDPRDKPGDDDWGDRAWSDTTLDPRVHLFVGAKTWMPTDQVRGLKAHRSSPCAEGPRIKPGQGINKPIEPWEATLLGCG